MTTNRLTCAECGATNRVPAATTGKPRCAKCRAFLPWLTDTEAADFDAVIAKSTVPVLVDLWAPWCGPCHMVAPSLVEISGERAGQLRIVKVDVDRAPEVSARLGVQGIPTMLLFRDGREVGRQVGALPGHQIRTWIDATLAQASSGSRQ
jgi:thioredoxin 2